MLAVMPVIRSAPSRTTIVGADGKREQVEQHEHLHVAQDVFRHDAAAQLDRQNRARVQRAPQLAQRTRAIRTWRTTFGPPAADPAQPPMNISRNSTIFA